MFFNEKNEDEDKKNETLRQTLERVMREKGMSKEPQVMHTEIGDFTYYNDNKTDNSGSTAPAGTTPTGLNQPTNLSGTNTASGVSPYTEQNTNPFSPTNGISTLNNFMDYPATAPAAQNTFDYQQTAMTKAIANIAPSATEQYTQPDLFKDNPRRTVYQSLTGFAENNQKWHENNPQKDSYNYVQDEYETNPLMNDCLKSDRYNTFVNNIKQPNREGFGFHVSDQPTNSGISQGWYDKFRERNSIIAGNYPQSVENLTQDQVDNLYCQGFYKPARIEAINNTPFAEHIFDSYINPGSGSGPRLLQESVNDITGWNIGTEGGIGTETVSAINNLTDRQLQMVNNRLVDKRKKYYQTRSKNKFKRGLLNRADQFRW
ncbi:MAG: hypothetical protein IKN71_03705 [Alphaproteobacteria bacterium]|nr:hypothetical protein [Alphaproteobacteria bacterium]